MKNLLKRIRLFFLKLRCKNYGLLVSYKYDKDKEWKNFKKMIRHSYGQDINLRRSSKKYIPFKIECGNCGDSLEIRRVKDWPTEDVKCACGDLYLVKFKKI